MQSADRPNVLWVCTDQQRFDTIGALGNPHIRTPNIDSLVSGGVAFERCYVQNPICTPSRASFLTGRYPRAHGVWSNGNARFPSSETLVTRLFDEAGYICGLIGKLHLTGAQRGAEHRADDGYSLFKWSNMPRPEDGTSFNNAYHHWLRAKGIDPWELFQDVDALIGPGVPAGLNQTDWVAESTSEFIESNKGRNWLLSVNPFAPHHPFDPSPEYLDRIDTESLPHPLFRDSDLERQEAFRSIQHQSYRSVDPRVPHDRGADPQRFPDGQFVKHTGVPDRYYGKAFKAAYYAMIEQVDDAIGRIVETLKATDQFENTIIIFTSDHGEMLGDHGLLLKGARFFEGAVRVPLIFHWPQAYRQGLRSNALVESIDIAPTLLEASGLDIPWSMQGRSLAGILQGSQNPDDHRDVVICEFFDSMGRLYTEDRTRATMTFDGRHKLISYHGHNLFELFDLENDPGEFDNLWSVPDYRGERWEIYRRQNDAIAATVTHSQQRTMLY